MPNLIALIVKAIKLPLIVIKWILYFIITYTFIFSAGFVVERSVGWHPIMKPVRDSVLVITMGIIKKATPYLQGFAVKFGEDPQATSPPAEIPQQTQMQKIDKANNTSASTLDAKDMVKNIERPEEQATLQKLTENISTLQKSMTTMHKKGSTQPVNRTPTIFYGLMVVNVIFLLLITYILYQKP